MITSNQIVPRKGPDIDLSELPRFWFGGDPFKTRLFDALSTVFPEGEKFFITSVREYRDQITDPKLMQEVKDFTYQEGQHSMVHRRYNDVLAKQGFDIAGVDRRFQRVFGMLRDHFPKWMPIASTSAIEHFTATFSHAFLSVAHNFPEMDVRVRSIYAWHSIEEFEHKSVAYDVMKDIAKVGYAGRVGVMLWVSMTFQVHIFSIIRKMLILDGFSAKERTKIWAEGMLWLYRDSGIMRALLPHYLEYMLPGYHPNMLKDPEEYAVWLQAYEKFEGDAIAAGNAALRLAA